jgi:succinate-acetate transporter protein
MNTENKHLLQLKDTSANPAPLGLLAFGMTTVILNLHNAGLFAFDTMILAMGIFFGGFAQIIAGVMEWKKNNTFGATAFTSYGVFWLTLTGFLLMGKTGAFPMPEQAATVSYFIIWGIFTLVMFIGTFRLSRPLQFVFGTLTLLFFLLATRDLLGKTDAGVIVGKVAGFEGIVCGLSAMYAGLSQVIKELYSLKPSAVEPAHAKSTQADFISHEIVDHFKNYVDQKLQDDNDEKIRQIAEEASKATITSMTGSIVAYIKKKMKETD